EASAAMAVLGVTDHRFLDLPDGGLADLDPAEPVGRIAALITEVRPDTILTFGPDGVTFHPDPQTVPSWATQASPLPGRRGRRPARPGRPGATPAEMGRRVRAVGRLHDRRAPGGRAGGEACRTTRGAGSTAGPQVRRTLCHAHPDRTVGCAARRGAVPRAE